MLSQAPGLQPVVVNTRRGTADVLSHLFRYDTVYGMWPGKVSHRSCDEIEIDGRSIAVTHADQPIDCDWDRYGVDVVLESTGAFTKRDQAAGHLVAGARKVLVSAPMADDDVTIVRGVNEDAYRPDRHAIVSGGSCTTNCLAPLAMVIDDAFGLCGGLMTTIHAYTRDQEILDGVHHDLRRARAAGQNMAPTKTGAARAVAKVLPHLAERLVGIAVRVPVPTVSLVDLSVTLEQETTVEMLNAAFRRASATQRLRGIFGVSDEPLVSSDYRGDPRSCVVDLASSRGAHGNHFKVLAWYDNEWAYACRMVDLLQLVGRPVSPAGRRDRLTDRGPAFLPAGAAFAPRLFSGTPLQ